MNPLFKKLEENRDAILLAEIGAYLHLLGRFSREFIICNATDADDHEKKFNYQRICDNVSFFEGTGLDTLLKDTGWKSRLKFVNVNNAGELSTPPKNFCEFIEKHTWSDGPKGLCKILADAHGIVSAIDKALAGRLKTSGKQRKAYLFKSTAFGYEEKIELMDNPHLKKEFFQKLKEKLNDIKQARFNKNNYLLYRNLVKLISEYYPKIIGDTRRPINEISLFDYAYTIASLMKSNIVKMILDGGWYEPLGSSKWKILKINIDILGLLSKAPKIGDILGYEKEVEQIFDNIKKKIEFECPLGNEIYRDSTGIYFSFPNLNQTNQQSQLKIKQLLKDCSIVDFDLQIDISEESRSLVSLREERERSRKSNVFHHISDTNRQLKMDKNMDVCPICRLNLKNKNNERCEKCTERYLRRAKKWIEKPFHTIWIDEVADHNDRVALIAVSFDLPPWLSGELVNTFVSQTFEEWKDENIHLCNRHSINTIDDLKNQFEQMFNTRSLSNNQKSLCRSFINISFRDFEKDFWYPIAERDATGNALRLADNSEKAKYLIKLLFRKHPSLARIRRIWKTTNDFVVKTIFNKILDKVKFGEETDNWSFRRKRICFKLESKKEISLLEGYAYQVLINYFN